MAPPPQASADLYSLLQRYQLLLLFGARRLWRGMTPDFDSSWARIAPSLVALTSGAQLAAARSAVAYVPAVLEETGQPDQPEAAVRPQAFAGVASDGRSLAGLLQGSVVASKRAMARGLDPAQALLGGRSWLETALQSAVEDAARDATQAAIIARPGMGWVRQINPPCCSRCAVLAGKWFAWNDGFLRHPRCFPAGVVVSGPGHEAATRRWFQGELVVLSTASGQQLALTGNHPVLTSSGWVPANLLREGSEVVRSTRPEGARALVVPDHHEVPARIEDVWAALSVAGFDTVPSAAEDFHGDGQEGQVDVVRADRPFHDRLLASLDEQFSQQHLTRRSGTTLALHRECAAVLFDLRYPPTAGGAVRGGDLGLAFLLAHSGGTRPPGLAGAAPWHPGRQQALGDGASSDAVLARQRELAGPGLIGLDDLVHRQVTSAPRWDAPGGSFSHQTADGYARLGGDLLQRLAGHVELDRVVEIRRVEWSGHVYSLTSVEGWHSANSLIVSNCDCVHIPSREDRAGDFVTDPDALVRRGLITDLTPGQRERLDGGADLVKVLNESRDRWRVRMAADRRAAGPVDRLGRSRPQNWAGGGTNPPPPGTTIHQLMDRLTDRVEALQAMRTLGIAD